MKDKLKIYLEQDINNPKYLFHGSNKKLNVLCPKLANDSNDNSENIAEAIFLFPSFLKSTPYAFKDSIKQISSNLEWDFSIPNFDTLPLMSMTNVNTNDKMIGYIYVFEKNSNMIKDKNSYQYKCYSKLVPIDVIEIKYGDYKKYYELNKIKSIKI